MRNPFALPARGAGDDRPLCPWETPEHEAYYVPVDHTDDAFTEFQVTAESALAGEVATFTVLVQGLQGCGKTALTHRCAFWMRKRSAELGVESHIIDLTADGLQGSDVVARRVHICGRLVDALRVARLFSGEELMIFRERQDHPEQLLPLLADLLKASNQRLIVLTPKFELLRELEAWRDAARQHLVFFCEASQAVELHGLDRVITLEVGPLDVHDGWLFVQSRLGAVAADPSPVTDEETVRKFMEKRIAHRGTTTIHELQRTCAFVFQAAVREARDAVAYEDFQNYYWGV